MTSVLAARRAGVLLHPTSLPGAGPNGTLGGEAWRFVDWLAAGGFSVWQTLPIG
ncbi:MAG TPA: 4-alpha-glucanotransferase, partial [Gammaproteobacteria bacterium]|nr:4-alpha-glucanotransferase [Gammaproteobacteria bacterium]